MISKLSNIILCMSALLLVSCNGDVSNNMTMQPNINLLFECDGLDKITLEKHANEVLDNPQHLVVNKGGAERTVSRDRLYMIAIQESNEYYIELRNSRFDDYKYSFSITINPSLINISDHEIYFRGMASSYFSDFNCTILETVEGSNTPESMKFYNELIAIKRGWYEQLQTKK